MNDKILSKTLFYISVGIIAIAINGLLMTCWLYKTNQRINKLEQRIP